MPYSKSLVRGASRVLNLAGAPQNRRARESRPAWDIVADNLRSSLAGIDQLSSALRIDDQYRRARRLIEISPEVSADLSSFMISTIPSYRDPYMRVQLWQAFARGAVGDAAWMSYDMLLSSVGDIKDPKLRARSLAGIAEDLPVILLPRILDLFRQVDYAPDRVKATTAVALQFPEHEKRALMQEALASALDAGPDAVTSTLALAGILPFVESEADTAKVAEQALESATSIPGISLRIHWLNELTVMLHGEFREKAKQEYKKAMAAAREEAMKPEDAGPLSLHDDKPGASYGGG